MGTILKHGSAEPKAKYLPGVASGELRLQAFAVTEPTAGTDTTRITTFAKRQGDKYIVHGKKIWISRAEKRSEERRVGKACVSTLRYRGPPNNTKKNERPKTHK